MKGNINIKCCPYGEILAQSCTKRNTYRHYPSICIVNLKYVPIQQTSNNSYATLFLNRAIVRVLLYIKGCF